MKFEVSTEWTSFFVRTLLRADIPAPLQRAGSADERIVLITTRNCFGSWVRQPVPDPGHCLCSYLPLIDHSEPTDNVSLKIHHILNPMTTRYHLSPFRLDRASLLSANLLFLALLPSVAIGQPTFVSADVGTVGDTYEYVQSAYMALTGTGANQTWDASSATPINTITFNWVTPGSTAGGSYFPDATVATSPVTLFQLDQYWKISPTKMEDMGTYIPAILTTCSDPILIVKFPLTYGTTWSDPFTCDRDDSGIIFSDIEGTVTANANGYGTFVTPYGEIDNVIRVALTNTSTIIGGGLTTETIIDAQYYWKPGLGSYVAYNYEQEQTINGVEQPVSSRFRYLSESSIGIDELLTNSVGIDVAPNPVDQNTLVTFSTQGPSTLEVFNAQGASVQLVDLGKLSPGIHQQHLDLSSLNAGMYTLVIRSADGGKGVERIIVQ